MPPHSPFYLFDPSSIGWLHRRHEKGELILAEDLVRLAEADSRNFEDPVFQEYALAAWKGELRRPKGRPSRGGDFAWRLLMADVLIDDRAADIRAERKRAGRHTHQGDFEPRLQAAYEVGRYLRLPVGRTLINAISSHKCGRKLMKGSLSKA